MSAYKSFYIKTASGEFTEASLSLDADRRSALCCTVTDKNGAPVSDALALLFKPAQEKERPALLQQTFTDDIGQFIFGPLDPGTLYLVKVFKNSIKLRELEISTE